MYNFLVTSNFLIIFISRELEEKARIEAEEAKKIMLEKEQQQKEEQQKRAIAEAAPIAVVQKAPEYSLSDMEAYIRKMTEYVNHMQMLEKRNQLLESENSRIQEVLLTNCVGFNQFLGKQSPSPRNGRSYKAWHHRSTDPEVLPELSVNLPSLTVSNSQYLLVSKYMFHHLTLSYKHFILSFHPSMRFGIFHFNLPPQKMPKLFSRFRFGVFCCASSIHIYFLIYLLAAS